MVKEYEFIKVDEDKCVGCGACELACPTQAINIDEGYATIAEGACIGCGACVGDCPTNALELI